MGMCRRQLSVLIHKLYSRDVVSLLTMTLAVKVRCLSLHEDGDPEMRLFPSEYAKSCYDYVRETKTKIGH